MKANELMIGDWVKTNDLYKAIKDVKVRAISQYSVQDETTSLWIECQHIEPIPLTKEILEKNGFVGDKQVMQYHFTEDGQKYHFSLRQMYDKDDNPKGYSFFAFSVLTIIDYVHQLQHALRLCRIDKEIVL